MKYYIRIKGNSKPFYGVSLFINGGKIIVSCECPAGQLGLMCHHKTDLLNGKNTVLYEPADVEALNEVKEQIKKTNYYNLLQEHTQIKKDIETLKKHEKDFRKMIERMMNNGLTVKVKDNDQD